MVILFSMRVLLLLFVTNFLDAVCIGTWFCFILFLVLYLNFVLKLRSFYIKYVTLLEIVLSIFSGTTWAVFHLDPLRGMVKANPCVVKFPTVMGREIISRPVYKYPNDYISNSPERVFFQTISS